MYTNTGQNNQNNPNNQNLGMGFNFNKAYAQNSVEIDHRDHQNHNELIHNNIDPELVNEVLNEYIIHVDGADRHRTIFPNPFKYVVTLGGVGPTKTNGGFDFSGNPNPRIERSYRNIKQLKIKYVLLPKYYKYDYQVAGNFATYTPSPEGTFLRNYRYLILRIKELDTDKINSTNSECRPNTFVLYKNSIYSQDDSYTDIWVPTQPIITYADTNLKNLNKLSLDIIDPSGNQIFMKIIENGVEKKMSYDDLNNSASTDTNINLYNWSFNVCLELSLVIAENELQIQKLYR